jgi:hypothetical protein
MLEEVHVHEELARFLRAKRETVRDLDWGARAAPEEGDEAGCDLSELDSHRARSEAIDQQLNPTESNRVTSRGHNGLTVS